MSNSREITTRPGALLAPQLDYFLIDGSGSMSSNWMGLHGALDGFMQTMLAQNADSHGIVSVFEGRNPAMIQRDSAIRDWPRFSEETLYSNFGYTPLYDAVNIMGRHMRDLDPPRASIVIATDGDNTDSITQTTHAQAKAVLDWCRAKGWQVTFLGVDFANEAQAKMLGANPRNTLAIQSAHLAEAGKTLGQKRLRNYRDPDTDIAFTDEEKIKFGGFLAAPEKK